MKRVAFITFLLVLTGFAAASGASDDARYNEEGSRWWQHIRFLASDRLEGRDTGSQGYREAVRYVTEQLKKAGLKPAGTHGYEQPVEFETRSLDRAQSAAALVRYGNREELEPGRDVNLSAGADWQGPVTAPMVFIGYGLTIPGIAAHSVDLKGKIAVYVAANGPQIAPQNVQSFYASAGERWAALRKLGAVGVATIANPRLEAPAPSPAPSSAPSSSAAPTPAPTAPPPVAPAVLLAEPALQDTAGQAVAVTISRRAGSRFFTGSGHSFDEILRLATANQPLPEFPLEGSFEVKPAVKKAKLVSSNVVALLPGSDTKLRGEYVVVSAHLDHIGVGAAVNGDRIYNGAMDNATGVASLIEIARLFREGHVRPRRSIVFLVVTAEEKGLLGSKYFAAHPTVPGAKIVADVNMDAILPLYELKTLEVQGLGESTLGVKIRDAAAALGVEVQSDREPEQNRFIRSDHFSFVHAGIPALAFKFGYEYGSEEEKTRLGWWDRNYHRPSDDTDHPMNQAAAAKFNHVILGLVRSIADDNKRPEWLPDSFFRQFARQ